MKRNIVLQATVVFMLISCQLAKTTEAQSNSNGESIEGLKELADFDNWPGKSGLVRDGLNLSKCIIPSLSGIAEFKNDQKHFFTWEIEEELLIKYSSKWQTSPENFLEITLTFANSCQEAHEYLIKRFFSSSMPFEKRLHKKDHPIIAGDISFDYGRYFIRNNIVVEFQGIGTILDKITAAAVEVDNLLLENSTAPSVNLFNPIIKQFAITKSRIKNFSSTKLIIDVYDPQGSELYYFWRLTAGGIEKNNLGDYQYYASGKLGSNQIITLIVVNDRGYYSTADVEVRIE